MCHAMRFSARALKKKKFFFDVDIVVKNKPKCGFSWYVVLSITSTRHYSFPKHFFRIFFWILSEFAKVFERVWRVQAAHLHNAVRALSNPSRCVQLSRQRWSKFVADSLGCASWVHNILTTVMTRIVVDETFYNNQINARALIGQSAVGYCYYKPTENPRFFWIII